MKKKRHYWYLRKNQLKRLQSKSKRHDIGSSDDEDISIQCLRTKTSEQTRVCNTKTMRKRKKDKDNKFQRLAYVKCDMLKELHDILIFRIYIYSSLSFLYE